MARMWQERADYGHFFYRIANGESAADAYDRVSGFNESLWRQFGEDDFPSVCILVTHGLMSRVFLMKWYHFSVEYFEDLRNVNHCEFLVMKRNNDNGKFVLQNQLRTWSELKRERAARGSISQPAPKLGDSPIPERRKWGSPDGYDDANHKQKRPPVRKNTVDMFSDEAVPTVTSLSKRTSITKASSDGTVQDFGQDADGNSREGTNIKWTDKPAELELQSELQSPTNEVDSSPATTPSYIASNKMSLNDSMPLPSGLGLHHLTGRDGGGSKSGAASQAGSSEEENDETVERTLDTLNKPRSLARAMHGEFGRGALAGSNSERAMADALGDQSDASVDIEDEEEDAEFQKKDEQRIRRAERRDKTLRGSVY